MHHGGAQAGKEVEEQVAARPHGAFHAVAEDPQVKHVAGEVHEPPVDEHGREQGQREGHEGVRVEQGGARNRYLVPVDEMGQFEGNGRGLEDEDLLAHRTQDELEKEDGHVGRQQPVGDHGPAIGRAFSLER